MGLVDDQQPRRAVGEHEGEFGAGEAEIQRHENGAEPCGGEHRDQEHRLVVAEKGQPFAARKSQRGEPRRGVFDVALRLRVSPFASLEGQRLAFGRA